MSRAQGSYVDKGVDRSLEYPIQRRRSRVRAVRRLLVASVLLVALAYVATDYWAEGLWFTELGFLSEFFVRSRTQIILGAFTLFASLGFTFFNFQHRRKAPVQSQLSPT